MPKPRTYEMGQVLEPHGWKVVHPDPVDVGQRFRKLWVICPVCGKDKWITTNELPRTRSCGCIAKRKEPVVGSQLRNGWTIASTETKRSGARNNYVTFWVSCPVCGKERWLRETATYSQKHCGCLRPPPKKYPPTYPARKKAHAVPEAQPPADFTKYKPIVQAFLEELELDPLTVIEQLSREYWSLPQEVRDGDVLQRSDKIQRIAAGARERMAQIAS